MNHQPPHSIESEQGVLACILQEPNESLDRCTTQLLPDGSAFYDRRHGDLYRTLVTMHGNRQPIDLITLHTYLRDTGKIEDCGGSLYVSELQGKAPSPANLPTYLSTVVDKWHRRKIINTCYSIVGDAETSTAPIAEVLDRAQGQVLEIGTEAVRTTSSIDAATLMRTAFSALEERNRGHARAISTGFSELDRLLTGGFKPGQLIVVAARPSTGKTAFGMQIAAHASESRPVGIFSLEMSADELGQREIARESQNDLRAFDPEKIPDKRTEKAVAIAANRIKTRRMVIDAHPTQTIERIRASARRWRHRDKVELVLVDYLQLVGGSGHGRDRREVVDEISRGLKILAKELEIPVVALAQLNRDSERDNRKPRLSDLRESGSIEQDADVVLLMYRCAGRDDDPDPSRIGCLIAKQRNGPTQCETRYRFDGSLFRFTEQSTKIPHEP